MHWQDIPAVMDDWAVKAAAPCIDVRRAASSVPTDSDVGYYYNPILEKVAVYGPDSPESDLYRCKASALRAVGVGGVRPLFLTRQELADPDGTWVKVAYSPFLRGVGEAANFFPGQYPGGLPNSPSPVAAMLTSGLLGAGLGWGTGKILGKLLPRGYGDRLGRTGLILGGALGASPGLVWGAVNKLAGKRFNDPSLLAGTPGEEPADYPVAGHGANAVYPEDHASDFHALSRRLNEATAAGLGQRESRMGKRGCDLGARYLGAVDHLLKEASTFGVQDRRGQTDIDVNINAMGQTLWETGAPPGLAATTMSALYAAQQLPDPDSRPGVATGLQLGQLAGDYARGALVGAALNAAIGTPFRASTFGAGNLALGVIGSVVPRLFGQ
jgi:hypothetical protein